MYKGRHCLQSDYYFLEKISKEFLVIIQRDNFELDKAGVFINTFSDFDSDIASKIRMYLDKLSTDKDKYLNRITNLLEELKTNVLVDIREHN